MKNDKYAGLSPFEAEYEWHKDKQIPKKLTVADFIQFAILYKTVDECCERLAEELDGEYADEIKDDLAKIYALITSVVTYKDGSKPENWHKISISESKITMTYNQVSEIADKINAFIEKGEQRSHSYGEFENAIVDHLNTFDVEHALEILLGTVAEL